MKVCFLDRDGVINVDVHFLRKLEDVAILRDFPDFMRSLHQLGYEFIIISNQSGLARGYFDWEQFHKTHSAIIDQLPYPILKTYVCPHHPQGVVERYTQDCGCRKPLPGLIHQALLDFPEIDMENSILVGDSARDCWSANSCSISSFYLKGKLVGEEGLPHDCIEVDCLKDIPGLIKRKSDNANRSQL